VEEKGGITMAIPKSLKTITNKQAEAILKKYKDLPDSDWECEPYGDFTYKNGSGYWLIRKNCLGQWEKGKVCM
jgi:hypothetical protein